MRKPPKKDVAAIWRDWKGNDVYLLKETLRYHITSLHLEETFILEQLKRAFGKPKYVVWNPGAKSENAVYDLPCSGKPWMLVAVKKRHFLPFRIITTLYAANDDRLPPANWKLLHGKR